MEVTVCGGGCRKSAAHLLLSLDLLGLVHLLEAKQGSSEGVGPGQLGQSGGEHGVVLLLELLQWATSGLRYPARQSLLAAKMRDFSSGTTWTPRDRGSDHVMTFWSNEPNVVKFR